MTIATVYPPVLISQPITLPKSLIRSLSGNYVLHIYEQDNFKWKTEGGRQLKSDVNAQLLTNNDLFIEPVTHLIEELIDDGIAVEYGWLRITCDNKFEVIFAIPESDYLADSFDKFYRKTNEIEQRCNKADFHLEIIFINSDQIIDEEKLAGDGFDLRLEVSRSNPIHEKR